MTIGDRSKTSSADGTSCQRLNKIKVKANQLDEKREEIHDGSAFDSLGYEHDDDKGGRAKLFNSRDNRHHIAGKGNPRRDYQECGPIFTKPGLDPLFTVGIMKGNNPPDPIFP